MESVAPEISLSKLQHDLNKCDEFEKKFGLPVFIPFDQNELLLGYQKRWIADRSPLKIAEKSRRTGITWAEAADAVLEASKSKEAQGTNHFYVGSNKEMAREFIEAAAMWAKAFNKAAGGIQEEIFIDDGQDGKEILTFVIYFASGFKIQALSSNPANLRGMQGNVTIDEAAFHDRLAEVLKAALALTMWGAKVRLISTHNGIDNLFNELIQDSRAGKKRYSVHTITLADACKEGLYQRICQIKKAQWTRDAESKWIDDLLNDTASQEDAREEYFCEPKKGGGTYIPRVLIEAAMKKDIPIIGYEAPDDFMSWTEEAQRSEVDAWIAEELEPLIEQLNPALSHSFGEDFARRGDLTVFVPLEISKSLAKRVPFVVELTNLTYDMQRHIMLYLTMRLPRLTGLAFDATGNGGYLAEAAALHFGIDMVEQVMLNDNWYREWMPKLKAEFEDQNIDIPKHQDILADMQKISVSNGTPKIDKGSDKGSDGRQRHGDFAVGLAMANRASWMDGSTIEFTPLPNKHDKNKHSDFNYEDLGSFQGAGCW
ncbi:terminase large subunit domain-containing protein [Pseudoalteromonas umbrosa]|uniref:terminase large subunit domain-containing protein n=1 Tax=Pseudoalteromonas umbrosa TaxID=3048489 RepID=UPI0024C45E8F|nr:terminase family protein [Pseudoalteromonas sp. B95]MDK1288502.1 terminase family protein [Pseudoalteromonas sp. B95]